MTVTYNTFRDPITNENDALWLSLEMRLDYSVANDLKKKNIYQLWT